MDEFKPTFYFVNTNDGKGVRCVESDSVVAWLYSQKLDETARKFSTLSHQYFDKVLEDAVKAAIFPPENVSANEVVSNTATPANQGEPAPQPEVAPTNLAETKLPADTLSKLP